jgi:hypothetical protein
MFDQIDFERRFYVLVTEEVNAVFAALLRSGETSLQQEGLKLQRQIMKSLHSIAEETAIQIFYGLLTNKESK